MQDIGGSLPNSVIAMENNIQTDMSPIYNTNASESLKNQLSDVLEFLTDFHTLSKIKVIHLIRTRVLNQSLL